MNTAVGPQRILETPELRTLYVWSFFSKLMVLTPFFALFLAHRLGVDTVEITFLFATYSAVRLLSEVPFGFLADRFSETLLLRLSSALALLGVVCLVIGPLPALYVGQALFAMSESASSGAQEALLYRLSRDERIRGLSYRDVQPAFTSVAWSGVVCAGAIGTLAAVISLDLLGLLAVTIAAITCLIALLLPTAPSAVDNYSKSETIRLRQLATELTLKSRFRFWFIVGAVTGFLLTVTYFTIQPLLNELAIAGPGNGLLYSAVTIFASFGAHLTNHLNARLKNQYFAFVAAFALMVVAILSLRISGSFVAIFVTMALLRFSWGWIGATTTTALNESIPIDDLRASIMSVQSLVSGLLVTVSLMVFAGLNFTATAILLILATFATCCCILCIFIIKRRRYGD